MKTIQYTWILMTSLFIGCELENEPSIDEPETVTLRTSVVEPYASNQMIVRYDETYTEADKQMARERYNIVNYETCSCADPTLELWFFSGEETATTEGSVEERVAAGKLDDDLEGADFNLNILHKGAKLESLFGPSDINIASNYITPINEALTIAMIDTGIDYNYSGFGPSFLYNSLENTESCEDNPYVDYFGWDFVDNDNDPFDYHGHGTSSAYITASTLEAYNIPFQLLPVRAFDNDGNGRQFDILCAFQYVVNNPDVDIVNMSFGWYHSASELFGELITEAADKVLITASAGNDHLNTDIIPHYPSSYPADNLLSIAGIANGGIKVQLSKFSNYGPNAVDFAAIGEKIPFYLNATEFIDLEGTSYASAQAAAFAGSLYTAGMTINELKTMVLSHLTYSENLSLLQYSSYVHFANVIN